MFRYILSYTFFFMYIYKAIKYLYSSRRNNIKKKYYTHKKNDPDPLHISALLLSLCNSI